MAEELTMAGGRICMADMAPPPAPASFSFDDVHKWLYRYHGSHERLPPLLEMRYEMESWDWLRLLGEAWSGFDYVGFYVDELFCALFDISSFDSPIQEMMDPEEKLAFEALPEQITIYRGCGPKNKYGFSWSLNRTVAEKFPFMSRYWADRPILLTATISKHRAAALKLGRGEEEIIVFEYADKPPFWTEEPILTDPAGNLIESGMTLQGGN